MLFASLTFLSLFFPLSILGYYALATRSDRNAFLLLISLIFYAWGEPYYVFLMIGIILMTYVGGVLIGRSQNEKIKTIVLIVAVSVDLLILFHYKYTGFARSILAQLGWADETFDTIRLPIGISFYTFQAISYLVDVWKNKSHYSENIIKTSLYISFFPQLIAGPIIKYHEVCDQIDHRQETIADFVAGLRRFAAGLAKKVLIANVLGEVVDLIFKTDVANQTPDIIFGAALFYNLQIYFDFSGYSDMAIGLAKMFGFHFPENFNYPYVSRSLTELWRRWHISLSTWFKEYVYIPLGGNRKGLARTILNLGIVFFLTGLWHGAAWNFVLWGVYQGIFVMTEKGVRAKFPNLPIPAFLPHLYLFGVLQIGAIFFRSENLSQVYSCLKVMFGLTTPETLTGWSYYFTPFPLAVGVLGFFISIGLFKNFLRPNYDTKWGKYHAFLANVWSLVLIILSYMFLTANSFNPFIYFRF